MPSRLSLAFPISALTSKWPSSSPFKAPSRSESSRVLVIKERCEYFDLHNELVPYGISNNWQRHVVEKKKKLIERDDECMDTLIVLQHYPVFTMGTGSSLEFLKFDVSDPPFEVHRTERGGEVTYHGPGQLVMYPILNLRNHKMDLHWYLRELEEVIIRALFSSFSIKAVRVPGLTGVWVGEQKIAAIGVKVTRWITYHGVAMNVTTDLKPFELIVPCGIKNRSVGSVKELLGRPSISFHENDSVYDQLLIETAFESLAREFSEIFQLNLHKKCTQLQPELLEHY